MAMFTDNLFRERITQQINELLKKATQQNGLPAYYELLDFLKLHFSENPQQSSYLMHTANKLRQAVNPAYQEQVASHNLNPQTIEKTLSPDIFDTLKTSWHYDNFVKNWASQPMHSTSAQVIPKT